MGAPRAAVQRAGAGCGPAVGAEPRALPVGTHCGGCAGCRAGAPGTGCCGTGRRSRACTAGATAAAGRGAGAAAAARCQVRQRWEAQPGVGSWGGAARGSRCCSARTQAPALNKRRARWGRARCGITTCRRASGCPCACRATCTAAQAGAQAGSRACDSQLAQQAAASPPVPCHPAARGQRPAPELSSPVPCRLARQAAAKPPGAASRSRTGCGDGGQLPAWLGGGPAARCGAAGSGVGRHAVQQHHEFAGVWVMVGSRQPLAVKESEQWFLLFHSREGRAPVGGKTACFWCFRGPPSCRCLPGAQLPHPAVAPAPEPGGPGRLPVPIPTPAHAHPPPSPAGGGPPAEAVCGAQDGWRAAHARQLHLPALQWPQIPLGCWHHGGSPAQVQPREVRHCTPRGLAAVGLGGMACVCGGVVIVVGGHMLCVRGLAGMLGVRSTCTHTPNSHAAPFSLPNHLLPARPPRPPTHQPLALTSPSRPRPATALQLCTLRQQQCSSPAPTPLRALRARRWAPRRWRCWRSGWARWRGCALRTSCGQVSLGADVIQGGLSSLGQRLCAAQGPRGGGPGSDCAEGGCVHNLLKGII